MATDIQSKARVVGYGICRGHLGFIIGTREDDTIIGVLEESYVGAVRVALDSTVAPDGDTVWLSDVAFSLAKQALRSLTPAERKVCERYKLVPVFVPTSTVDSTLPQ
jgi:hypothetical protein